MFKGSTITRPALDETCLSSGKTAVARAVARTTMPGGNCGNCANLEKARGMGLKRVGACSARSCGNCANASVVASTAGVRPKKRMSRLSPSRRHLLERVGVGKHRYISRLDPAIGD